MALSKFQSSDKQYDLCFISEYAFREKNNEDYWNNYWLTLSEIISELAKKKKYKIIIALNGSEGLNEINYFKSIFPNDVHYSNPNIEYDSYRAILESTLVVGFCSSLLVESLALKARVLQINTSNSNKYFDFDDIFIHNYNNFDVLVQNIDKLISTPYEDYYNKISNLLPEYMNIDLKNLPQNLIRNNINKILMNTQI